MRRFLVITELFLPTKGGTAVWFDEVYRRIGDRSTHIVTAAVDGAERHDIDHPNTIHRLSLQRVAWLKPESLLMYLRLFIRSMSLALTRRFTAIHAGRALPEGFVGWLVARLTGHRFAVYAHGEELTTWGSGAKFKVMCFVLTHADVVIANSDYTRETLIRMGVDSKRIELINPGVDTDRFRPDLQSRDLRQSLGLTDGASLMLSVGRLSRRKGFDSVIEALPRVIEKGFQVHYALIGIGEDRDYLWSLVHRNDLESRVHLLGHVEPQDLPRWYCGSDLFVMPNREINGDTEGFGMVFLEAAACGRPAIAGRAGGTGAAVVDEVTGLRVDTSRPGELEAGIERLLGDPDLARRMGEAGLARARECFSWPRVASRVDQLEYR